MRFELLTVGKTNFNFVSQGIGLFLPRITKYVPFLINEVNVGKMPKSLSPIEVKKREATHILKNIEPTDFVILLDENGKEFSSVMFAEYINSLMVSRKRKVVFIVGGAYGFADEIYARANAKITLSRMTFSHQLIRLIFIEQFYRAHSILNNEPYHNE